MKWVMISTSSPTVSVAVFEDDRLLAEQSEKAPMKASGTALRILEVALRTAKVNRHDVELWAADLGPGSFTGVKVGLTLAKTLAYAFGKPAAGFASFELIDASAAAVPSRKGMFLVRDAVGIEELSEQDARVLAAIRSRPSAARAASLYNSLRPVSPEELIANYVLEPSISTPRKAAK